MKSLNLKKKNLKKILCLFIILFNFHIIFDKLINTSYEKSSKIDNFLIIKISNNNATQFENLTYDGEVIWGNNITFSLNFTYTEDNGMTWDPVLDPSAYCNITISDPLLTTDLIKTNMTPLGNGLFFKAINSSRLSAGGDSEIYIGTIEGYCPGYPDPNPNIMIIKINAIPTGMSIHNYTSMPDELPKNTGGDYEISEYYGFTINITARYFDIGTNSALPAESFTFDWDYGSGSLAPGPSAGYYTFSIDTSDATNVGKYRIDLTANYENYTKIENFGIYLNIISRPTTINGSSGLFYVSEEIFIFEALNFTFDYFDEFTGTPIPSLDEMSYLLQKIDEFGDPIPETTEMGSLVETVDNRFVLDLDTETRLDGKYSIIVTLDKLNYDHKIAIIFLEILPIPMSINGTSSNITISKEIEYQKAYNFTFEINNTLTHSRIGDLDQAFYYWYRIDITGTILEGPSEYIDLIKDANDLYILDFNSELKSIGFYRIHVEFHKENYSSRYAIINFTISPPPPLKININSPSPYYVFGIISPDFELDIIGSYDTIWYTIDNGDTNITVSALSGTINQIEWEKRENGIISIKFYANNSNGFVGYALVQVIKSVSEQHSPKVFGYDLMILLGVISIITLTIKKKIFEQGLKKES